MILPGIEGESILNRDIALGLDEGGVSAAIEVYDWTIGVPGAFVPNLAFLDRNKRQAAELARRIVEYREDHPGAPVFLIGHSAGGGVVVLTLEALPAGRQIDMAILLAPALSPDYDLSTALRRTRRGITSFFSSLDVGFLRVGTIIFGAVDRKHGSAAGAVGFVPPEELSAEDRELYGRKLRQVRWTQRLRRVGASGLHIGWASQDFAREYLAPLILRSGAARATTGTHPAADSP